MKIRSGFVSNSSSSSYIIRGAEITKEEAVNIATLMGKEIAEDDDLVEVLDEIFPYASPIRLHEKRNYFDGDEETGFIIGRDMGDLEDGSFVEIPEPTKEEDAETLKVLDKYGVTGQLKTYVKMISNDNY